MAENATISNCNAIFRLYIYYLVELIEYIASLYNCEIEIIDNTEKSEQQELVEDLVQIITVSSCKLQGKRANKAKRLIRELIQEETDGKSHKSNVDTKQRTEN